MLMSSVYYNDLNLVDFYVFLVKTTEFGVFTHSVLKSLLNLVYRVSFSNSEFVYMHFK